MMGGVMGGGSWLGWGLLHMVLFWGLVLLVLFGVIGILAGPARRAVGGTGRQREPDARELLRRRYASGEIERDEYYRRLNDLGDD